MSKKSVLYECEGTKLRYDVAVALRKIADGLAQGTLELPQSLGGVVVPVGSEVNFEIEIKEKAKETAVKRSIEIELEWYDEGQAAE